MPEESSGERSVAGFRGLCFQIFSNVRSRDDRTKRRARLSFSLSLLGRLASKSDDTTRFLFLYVYYLSADPISLSLLFHKTLAFDAQIARNQPVGRWRPNAEARVGADARARVEAPIEGDHRARFVVNVGSVSDFRSGTTVRERGDFADGVREF